MDQIFVSISLLILKLPNIRMCIKLRSRLPSLLCYKANEPSGIGIKAVLHYGLSFKYCALLIFAHTVT